MLDSPTSTASHVSPSPSASISDGAASPLGIPPPLRGGRAPAPRGAARGGASSG
eukprot:CAMPEP_0204590200 /NCGR_PEP_ID=MMETSP0661-20131031/49657_1 /ASSEMBLY_ACC=CAM_ASM_000606 /TAXON_ID=109239 /ORGANISM="Alexandrium margalefi, Strain AMGDE01CS-322" /LENGTH=53 /DNA_ID=CAMNT_0051600211 /DNA_START=246 /DNA_END=403 /DNA_ORIENTATION=+